MPATEWATSANGICTAGCAGVPFLGDRCVTVFDHEFFSNNCAVDFRPKAAFYWDENGNRVKFGKWEPNGQTDQALDFIDRHAGKEQPIALFVSWHPPHNHVGGYPAPAEYEKLYDPAKIKLRPSCADTPRSRAEYRGYMAMCTNLDDNVGRLLKKLDEKGVLDNTLVVYTSDHGDLLRSHGIHDWHKSVPEQVSCRVPLILRWPGQLPPRVSDMLVGTLDLMPTLKEAKVLIDGWRWEYNNLRPHSSLSYRAPAPEAWVPPQASRAERGGLEEAGL